MQRYKTTMAKASFTELTKIAYILISWPEEQLGFSTVLVSSTAQTSFNLKLKLHFSYMQYNGFSNIPVEIRN